VKETISYKTGCHWIVMLWPLVAGLGLGFIGVVVLAGIFRSPVRGFGSLTRARGTKGPRSQENERKEFGRRSGWQPR
jgi:hypothetical protein